MYISYNFFDWLCFYGSESKTREGEEDEDDEALEEEGVVLAGVMGGKVGGQLVQLALGVGGELGGAGEGVAERVLVGGNVQQRFVDEERAPHLAAFEAGLLNDAAGVLVSGLVRLRLALLRGQFSQEIGCKGGGTGRGLVAAEVSFVAAHEMDGELLRSGFLAKLLLQGDQTHADHLL